MEAAREESDLTQFEAKVDACGRYIWQAQQSDSALRSLSDDVFTDIKKNARALFNKDLRNPQFDEDAQEIIRAIEGMLDSIMANKPIEQSQLDKVGELAQRANLEGAGSVFRRRAADFKVDNGYKDARLQSLVGLLVTLTIVTTVVLSIAAAGPTFGTSLLPLLALGLVGAGAGLPKAVSTYLDKHEGLNAPVKQQAERYQQLKEDYNKAIEPSEEEPQAGEDLSGDANGGSGREKPNLV